MGTIEQAFKGDGGQLLCCKVQKPQCTKQGHVPHLCMYFTTCNKAEFSAVL